MRSAHVAAALVGSWLAVSCSKPRAGSNSTALEVAARDAALAEGVVALVGTTPIADSTVARIAARQELTTRVALEREIADALLAQGANELGYLDRPEVRAAVRGLLARARLEMMHAQTSASAIEHSEVDEATERHFVEFDRPEAYRVVHGLIKLPEGPSEDVKRRARVAADALAVWLAGVKDEAEFKARAEAFAQRDGFDLIVESLAPVAADGRVVDVEHPLAGGMYEESFARAAARLQHPGEQSPVVATSYGLHVLMLLERSAAHVLPYDERAAALRQEILTGRSRKARASLVEELRKKYGVETERSADALLASVELVPHDTP